MLPTGTKQYVLVRRVKTPIELFPSYCTRMAIMTSTTRFNKGTLFEFSSVLGLNGRIFPRTVYLYSTRLAQHTCKGNDVIRALMLVLHCHRVVASSIVCMASADPFQVSNGAALLTLSDCDPGALTGVSAGPCKGRGDLGIIPSLIPSQAMHMTYSILHSSQADQIACMPTAARTRTVQFTQVPLKCG